MSWGVLAPLRRWIPTRSTTFLPIWLHCAPLPCPPQENPGQRGIAGVEADPGDGVNQAQEALLVGKWGEVE